MRLEELTSQDFWGNTHSQFITREASRMDDHLLPPNCLAFETSGTSGKPKWIVHTKEGILYSAHAVNAHLEVNDQSVWGLALPVHHVGGFGIIARAYAASCACEVFQEKWNATQFAQWVEANSISHVSLVPTQVFDLVHEKISAPSCLRAVIVGGGHLPESIGQAARDSGWPVLASYGMTEAASQIATQNLEELTLPFSQSLLEILPIWETRLADHQVLQIRGKSLFCGEVYQNQFTPRELDWFTSNDRVHLDKNHLKPIGRTDSLVKVLGELVDTEKVRDRLLSHAPNSDWASRFCIIALPDVRRGHHLYAVFEGEMNDFLQAFTSYQAASPGLERFTGSFCFQNFPRSELGKIQTAEVSEWCKYELRRTTS